MRDVLERKVLHNVRKPARYTGGELNSIKKSWDSTEVKVALSYPDVYEVGMSNLGLQILYHIINGLGFALAERCYAPWGDMEAELRKNRLPLYGLESFTPLSEFDLIGFSIQHELTYTNMINMLDLSGIPIRSRDRKSIVFAGGPCSLNPEPVADFIDFFLIGEGEEAIVEILTTFRKSRGRDKEETLKKLSEIDGVWVPSLERGGKVKKRFVKDLNNSPYPTKPVVPFIETVHDRAMIEIMRGCPRSCKFCQARPFFRPLRTRKKETLLKQAGELIGNTGFEELSLVSLSTSDYPGIGGLARELADRFSGKRVSIALPSVRMDSFSIKLAEETARVRPSSVTLAPESGTQRLRDLIGKGMTEDDILSGAAAAFEAGIRKIKLYFMIGLPEETEEDIRGIIDLAGRIASLAKGGKRARITVSVSTFIPKPHTPFEREAQISIDETLRKQKLLKDNLRDRSIELRWHDAAASFIEGAFARGDRKLSKVIETAWKKGARMDAWSECFNLSTWDEAFRECGIDPNAYLRKRKENDVLPWSFIEA